MSHSSSSSSKPEILDTPLHEIGFEYQDLTSEKATGYFRVTHRCCQPFGILHGGVSALVAEGLASFGALIACGFKLVAGIQLSVNHLKPAKVGDLIYAEAVPVNAGRTIQVWEVCLWKVDHLNSDSKSLVATAKVTLLSSMPMPNNAKEVADKLKRHSKL